MANFNKKEAEEKLDLTIRDASQGQNGKMPDTYKVDTSIPRIRFDVHLCNTSAIHFKRVDVNGTVSASE